MITYDLTYFLALHGALAGIAFSYSLLPYYPPTSIFSKYYPQTSENQFLEEALTGLCVIAIPYIGIRQLLYSY